MLPTFFKDIFWIHIKIANNLKLVVKHISKFWWTFFALHIYDQYIYICFKHFHYTMLSQLLLLCIFRPPSFASFSHARLYPTIQMGEKQSFIKKTSPIAAFLIKFSYWQCWLPDRRFLSIVMNNTRHCIHTRMLASSGGKKKSRKANSAWELNVSYSYTSNL